MYQEVSISHRIPDGVPQALDFIEFSKTAQAMGKLLKALIFKALRACTRVFQQSCPQAF